eukprot:gene18778-biopygen5445
MRRCCRRHRTRHHRRRRRRAAACRHRKQRKRNPRVVHAVRVVQVDYRVVHAAHQTTPAMVPTAFRPLVFRLPPDSQTHHTMTPTTRVVRARRARHDSQLAPREQHVRHVGYACAVCGGGKQQRGDVGGGGG